MAAVVRRKVDFLHLTSLIEDGVIQTVIDRRYPLEDMVEAHRHVDSSHKQGHLIITMSNKDEKEQER